MPEVFIDGKRYEYEGSHKALQFMLDNNIEVPFFCYHPAMSIPANCRQCLVKAGTPVFNREKKEFETDENGNRVIRYFPKLQTSCSMDLSDGMVIHTQNTSDEVVRAHKDNLEFILINHPLDCPICDQAGECPLQIQTYKYGPEGSRFEFKKVHKPKRVQLGPRVTLDAERCINCTRCVRFCNEISKSDQLTIISRGDKNYPAAAPGHPFDDPYSLNTVDICPVGALTSSDFRFRARVWEMNQTPSVDMTNGKGTNVDLWTRDNLVLRITPRYNPEVNDYWMPDAGRDAYRLFNENRISRPEIKLDGTNNTKSSWNNVLMTLAEELQKRKGSEVLFLGSTYASVEDNFVVNKFLQSFGVEKSYFIPHIIEGAGDDFLLDDDQAPNTTGVRLLGFNETSDDDLRKLLASDKISMVVSLSDDIIGRTDLTPADFSSTYLVSFATNNTETTKAADLVVPITCAAEHAASYVNVSGRIQRTFPAKETLYTHRTINPEMAMGRLDRFGTKFDNWVSDKNRVECVQAWEFIGHLAEQFDKDFTYQSTREIMHEIALTIAPFNGVSYQRMDEENGIQLDLKQTEGTSPMSPLESHGKGD